MILKKEKKKKNLITIWNDRVKNEAVNNNNNINNYKVIILIDNLYS